MHSPRCHSHDIAIASSAPPGPKEVCSMGWEATLANRFDGAGEQRRAVRSPGRCNARWFDRWKISRRVHSCALSFWNTHCRDPRVARAMRDPLVVASATSAVPCICTPVMNGTTAMAQCSDTPPCSDDNCGVRPARRCYAKNHHCSIHFILLRQYPQLMMGRSYIQRRWANLCLVRNLIC